MFQHREPKTRDITDAHISKTADTRVQVSLSYTYTLVKVRILIVDDVMQNFAVIDSLAYFLLLRYFEDADSACRMRYGPDVNLFFLCLE